LKIEVWEAQRSSEIGYKVAHPAYELGKVPSSSCALGSLETKETERKK